MHAEAVQDATDVNQFARQIEQAHEVLQKSCETACADAGYADTEELEKIDSQGIEVIVPSQRQALHEEEKPFSKNRLTELVKLADKGIKELIKKQKEALSK